jgi:hypothetical protein
MRIRTDSVFVSSALFTIALVSLIPTFVARVLTSRDKVWLARLEADYRLAAQTMSDLSVVCLAVILIGLIIVWSGYVNRARWTWFVMVVVVWVWAFPLLAFPPFEALFKGTLALTLPEWIHSAIYQPGSPRNWAESVLIFLLMVIALLLPIKSFFFANETQPRDRISSRLVGFSAMGLAGRHNCTVRMDTGWRPLRDSSQRVEFGAAVTFSASAPYMAYTQTSVNEIRH